MLPGSGSRQVSSYYVEINALSLPAGRTHFGRLDRVIWSVEVSYFHRMDPAPAAWPLALQASDDIELAV